MRGVDTSTAGRKSKVKVTSQKTYTVTLLLVCNGEAALQEGFPTARRLLNPKGSFISAAMY